MSTSLLYHAFGIIGYFYQSTSYISGAVIVAIRDDSWRPRCPVCRSRKEIERCCQSGSCTCFGVCATQHGTERNNEAH